MSQISNKLLWWYTYHIIKLTFFVKKITSYDLVRLCLVLLLNLLLRLRWCGLLAFWSQNRNQILQKKIQFQFFWLINIRFVYEKKQKKKGKNPGWCLPSWPLCMFEQCNYLYPAFIYQMLLRSRSDPNQKSSEKSDQICYKIAQSLKR